MTDDARDDSKKKQTEMQVEVGKNIQRIRKANGLSQTTLAAKINASKQSISEIEKGGRNITLGTMAILAEALGCQIKDLLPQARPEAKPNSKE